MHKFEESLAMSRAQADEPWWEDVYRAAFPSFAGMIYVADDGWAQRGGIDRVITLTSGKTLTVDEKSRSRDWPDIAWEYLSSVEDKKPGWCCKDLACDYIAYAFVPSRTCYLLPALQLRKAFLKHGRKWVQLGRSRQNGFQIIRAVNDGYTTASVAVPIRESLDAIRDAMIVSW